MQIIVTHKEGDLFQAVANVTIPKGMDDQEALQYAYEWTNNKWGSWSIQCPEGMNEENADWNGYVDVLVDMSKERLGLRSSMMGDIFLVDGKPWEVAHTGFTMMETT